MMAVERAMSLFMTYDATHVMRLSRQPMRLAIFALPQISSDVRAESELAAAQRIGELIFGNGLDHDRIAHRRPARGLRRAVQRL